MDSNQISDAVSGKGVEQTALTSVMAEVNSERSQLQEGSMNPMRIMENLSNDDALLFNPDGSMVIQDSGGKPKEVHYTNGKVSSFEYGADDRVSAIVTQNDPFKGALTHSRLFRNTDDQWQIQDLSNPTSAPVETAWRGNKFIHISPDGTVFYEIGIPMNVGRMRLDTDGSVNMVDHSGQVILQRQPSQNGARWVAPKQ